MNFRIMYSYLLQCYYRNIFKNGRDTVYNFAFVNLPVVSTPNSIFISIKAQFLVAQTFSKTSKTRIEVLVMMSTSVGPETSN
jgi:hypothetical protein